jgi:DNA replication and repair protein RecF
VVRVDHIEVRDLRNIKEAALELHPRINVLVGRNAQGKTSVLEAVGLLARGRSFRTDTVHALIRHGAPALSARASTASASRESRLEVELQAGRRRLRVDGRDVAPRAYQGRLEVVVYSTDRLAVVRGPMRERRQFVDRQAAALWPAYRQTLKDYDRVLRQRNAALDGHRRDQEVWDEQFIEVAATYRLRRAAYVHRLRNQLQNGFRPAGEVYDIRLEPEDLGDAAGAWRSALRGELLASHADERRLHETVVGPHRDAVELQVGGRSAAAYASAGQARSLLLALTLAALEVFREERGEAPVALLDDLDSELDDPRVRELCQEVARRGQALVTTAHLTWAHELREMGRAFEVSGGQVIPA